MVVGLARRRRPPIQACPCQKPPRWLGVQQHPRSHQRSVARLPRPRRSDGTHGPRRRRRRRGRGCRVGGGGGPPVSRHLRAGGRPGGAGLGIEQQQLVVQRVAVMLKLYYTIHMLWVILRCAPLLLQRVVVQVIRAYQPS